MGYQTIRRRAAAGLRSRVIFAAIALALWLPGMAASAHVQVRSQAVITAIQRGADYLLAHQKPRTLWEIPHYAAITGWTDPHRGLTIQLYNDYGAETAQVTEALLDVEQTLDLPELNIYAPKMRAAINFLVNVTPQGTYAASFQANVMALLPTKNRYRRVLEKDAFYLLKTIHSDGGYDYFMRPPWPRRPAYKPAYWDNSNTQYGILGI